MEKASYKMEYLIDGLVQLVDLYTTPVADYTSLCFKEALDSIKQAHKISEQINISFDFNSAPKVLFHQPHLYTILHNLLDNAIRHNQGKENLKIEITAKKKNDTIFLRVADNGVGIHEKQIEQVTNPFYKHSEDEMLVGLGLSKIAAIAKVTNCSFSIESCKDLGTTCQFIFQQ